MKYRQFFTCNNGNDMHYAEQIVLFLLNKPHRSSTVVETGHRLAMYTRAKKLGCCTPSRQGDGSPSNTM